MKPDDKEELLDANEDSSSTENQEEIDVNEDGTDDGLSADPDLDSSDDGDDTSTEPTIPYERFKEVNDRQKAFKKELDDIRSEQKALREQDSKVSDDDLRQLASTDPVAFAEKVYERKQSAGKEEVNALKKQLSDMKFRQQVAESRNRYSDFADYENEIVGLIEDDTLPVDPSKSGAMDMYYMIAKSRRSSGKQNRVVKKTSNKVPKIEGARKKAGAKSQPDFADMSLEDLEKHIGTSERR